MGLSRRFLNLIVENPVPGIRSLLCMDLTRHQFFNPTPPPTIGARSESAVAQDSGSPKQPACSFNLKIKQPDGAAFMLERFQLPVPTFTFRAQAQPHAWKIDCFPLADRKVICVDQAGRTFLFDADTRQLVTMPSLHKPKWNPFSMFIPSTDDGGRLYVMERDPRSEASRCVQHNDHFEAFVYHKPTETSFESWHCQLLPPPPFVRDYAYSQERREITSYSLVGDNNSHILISAGNAGTYCLDTVSNIWSRVGGERR
ncbi:hypothetical protein PVAP13_6NG298000 [Panicum virgatum]|uniref:Uncharacterized protein n=1 Tax=Panicum virgatum TaxID=38727 RepID=A0A8T0R3M5_PANVG|nr:hypothetical protein PVAP13_6NG298000 [Panicum virgatum]